MGFNSRGRILLSDHLDYSQLILTHFLPFKVAPKMAARALSYEGNFVNLSILAQLYCVIG